MWCSPPFKSAAPLSAMQKRWCVCVRARVYVCGEWECVWMCVSAVPIMAPEQQLIRRTAAPPSSSSEQRHRWRGSMCPPSSVRYLSKRAALQPPSANMNKDYSINLSVQQVLSLWVQGTEPTLQHFTGTFTRGERWGETGSCVSSSRAHTPLSTPASLLYRQLRASHLNKVTLHITLYTVCLHAKLIMHHA